MVAPERACRQPLGELPGAVPAQLLDERSRQRDRSARPGCLWFGEHQSGRRTRQGAAHPQRAGVEAYVRPAQRQRLTTTEPYGHRHGKQSVEALTAGRLEQRLRLRGGQDCRLPVRDGGPVDGRRHVPAYQAVADRVVQRAAEHGVDEAHRGVGQTLLALGDEQLVDVGRGSRSCGSQSAVPRRLPVRSASGHATM